MDNVRPDSPASEFELTVRDQLAYMERTTPIFETEEDLAGFLNVPIDLVERKGVRHYHPQALAKWRYSCADAMLKARRKRIGKPSESRPDPDHDPSPGVCGGDESEIP